jgi:hypothetical protein
MEIEMSPPTGEFSSPGSAAATFQSPSGRAARPCSTPKSSS